MTDSTSLEAEIDVLLEEMKFWEQGMVRGRLVIIVQCHLNPIGFIADALLGL
jgi:hypothetical protein